MSLHCSTNQLRRQRRTFASQQFYFHLLAKLFYFREWFYLSRSLTFEGFFTSNSSDLPITFTMRKKSWIMDCCHDEKIYLFSFAFTSIISTQFCFTDFNYLFTFNFSSTFITCLPCSVTSITSLRSGLHSQTCKIWEERENNNFYIIKNKLQIQYEHIKK